MEPSTENTKKKSIKKWIIVLLIAIVAVVAIYYFMNRKKAAPETFQTATAHYGYIGQSITATGTVEPVDTVAVGSQISGVINKIYADFNTVVKKGQLLATIDPTIILAQKEQSIANVATAMSNLEYQQSNYNRQNSLFNLGAISKADYQIAKNGFMSAKAAVANAKAQLQITSKNLFYTKIYSPIDGIVLNRNVSEGQTIASSFNAPTLFVIANDLTKMQVRAAVDEADIGNVKSGQNVSFTVDAFPDEVFKGKVQEILLHAKVNANIVTYTTLINVDNNKLNLKPGMTASINIYTKENSNALIIPVTAVNFKPDSTALKQFVIVHSKNNQAIANENSSGQKAKVWTKSGDTLYEKSITTDITDDINVEVISGLKDGDKVIASKDKTSRKSEKNATQTSPFMPKFGNRKPANTNK